MLKDLFFDIYKDFGGSLDYLLFIFAYIIIGIVVYSVISGIVKYKSNPAKSLILIFASVFLGILLCLPSISAGISLHGESTRNEKLQELSIAVTPISWQKGVYYLRIGGNYKKGKEALKYYDKAYELIGSYKYKCWRVAPLAHYYFLKDYDKALQIAELHHEYSLAASCYIMKNDYQKALNCINDAIDKKPNNGFLYAKRGFICNKLGQKELAEADLKMALKLGKENEKLIKAYYNDWKSYELNSLAERRKEVGID